MVNLMRNEGAKTPAVEDVPGLPEGEANEEASVNVLADNMRQRKGKFAEAADMGLSCFPIREGSKKPDESWKHRQTNMPSSAEIEKWDSEVSNIAIVTGMISGIFVLDVDSDDALIEARNKGLIAPTREVKTGRGIHFYYRMPDFQVKNRAGIIPKVDVRGEGGFVVGAGSIHPDGHKYFCSNEAPIAAAPSALLDLLRPKKHRSPHLNEMRQLIVSLRESPEGQRNDTLNRVAFRIGQLAAAGKIDRDEIESELHDAGRACGLDDREIESTLDRAIEEGIAAPRRRETEDEISQVSVAETYVESKNGGLKHDHSTAKTLFYNSSSGHFAKDEKQLLLNEVAECCVVAGDGSARFASHGFVKGASAFVKAHPDVAATSKDFDCDDMLLGTPRGPVDLTSGRLIDPDPSHMITKQTGIAPRVGTARRWTQFLCQSTGGDALMIRFVHQLCGYLLTGSTKEQILVFIYGPGGNGKSVFINILSKVLKDYAVTAPMEAFTSSKNDQHPTIYARMDGARLASASETEQGRTFAEARIKQLTGGDPIPARYMRQDFFEFDPKFKLVIVGNHHPVLARVDDALRRRFIILPFILKPETPDQDLERKLEGELPEILGWMIEGCLDWQKNGLIRPQSVMDATKNYLEDQDIFGQWLDEYCEIGPKLNEGAAALYHNWQIYNEASGEKAGSQKSFGSMLAKQGFRQFRQTTGDRMRCWAGLRLLTMAGEHGSVVPKTPKFSANDVF